MSEQPYFNHVTSESIFKSRFDAEGGKTFSELTDTAASGWGRPNLLASRVIRRPKLESILPVLSKYSSPPILPTEIKAFIDGPEETISFHSEHRLVHTYGPSLGQLWAALSALTLHQHIDGASEGSEGDHEDDGGARSKRVRRSTLQDDDFVSSSMIQVGSSSPITEHSSQGSSSVGYVDANSQAHPVPLEDMTLRLAGCVIRHLLFFGPPQNSDSLPFVVEFRDAKTRLVATTPHQQRRVVAIDDGGLFLRENFAGKSRILKSHVAILEAKKQFQRIENGRPVISDSCFAQMTCEAMAARLRGHEEDSNERDSVVVINFTQHYACILQFEISNEYLQDFDSATPRSFIYVYSTPWLDISTKRGRENIVANLCRLMAWGMDS
ncbi:hypothetical protein EDB81DRAFT_673295 [Dactylonectria macrodidyma]|uniref:Uncharacterized protein n=1 Tax=Dactylonectria macrodidyma TaxID=307937 RepID=A0A9P9I6F1_9HYPO|nr:hypothetical protein EDB81DRAFT_673295 [Dactylonectria macrodidyma]